MSSTPSPNLTYSIPPGSNPPDRTIHPQMLEYYRSASPHSGGWRRVGRNFPCPVCGKPSWCSFTADGKFLVCMRAILGSVGEREDGGHIYPLSDDVQLRVERETRIQKITPRKEVTTGEAEAELHRRDLVYQTLIEISPCDLAAELLIDGQGGLKERGLAHLSHRYGMIPGGYRERVLLAKRLATEVSHRHPELSEGASHPGHPLAGVPGFWVNKEDNDTVTLWKPDEHDGPLLVIPYRDHEDRIRGCQLRMPGVPKDYRYRWLSSASYEDGGVSSGAPIHFAGSPVDLSEPRPALITEGALKAESSHQIFTAPVMIATAGTTVAHADLIEAALRITQKKLPVTIAFDSDHLLAETEDQMKTSRQVSRQIARLTVGLLEANATVRILLWPVEYKGLDDVLIAVKTIDGKIPFRSLTPADWLQSLPPPLRGEAEKPFKDRSRQNR